jgi:hypothetical protein
MLGGAGYMAGRAGQRAQYQEQTQDARISDLEASQQPPPPTPAAPTNDLVARLKELSALKASGALNDDEFEAAKAKLLAT